VTRGPRTLVWVEREIPVAAEAAWRVLVDVPRWPEWGPSVRAAGLDGDRLEQGATGWVRTAFGVRLPFEVTAFEEGHRWSWTVAGVPSTDHRVRPLGPATCAVGFGVPRIVAPYAIVCRRALATIDRLLTS
jgi:hypothetical protein